MSYTENMTPEQTEAIMAESPLIIVRAGAGSGKTRVMINRARRLNSLNRSVLMTTFTRAARKEIEERLNINPLETHSIIDVLTLNSLAWRIAGHPNILGYDEKIRIMKTILKEITPVIPMGVLENKDEAEDDEENKASAYLGFIDKLHANNVFGECPEIENQNIRFVLSKWDEMTKGLVDATTIFKVATDVIKQNPDKYCQWNDILIDEAQDLSLIQYHMIIALTNNKKNNCVMIGDPDQSIYAFRSAIPGFLTDYYHYDGYTPEEVKNISLTTNYRCTKQIVNPAVSCINSIEYRTPKILEAIRDGEAIKMIKCSSEKNEAKYIVDRIEFLLNSGVKAEEIACLSRQHRSLNALISELSKRHIPYIQVRAEFMKRPDTILIKSIIDLLLNYNDIQSAQTILEVLYGIKNKSIIEEKEHRTAFDTLLHIANTKKQKFIHLNDKFLTLLKMVDDNTSPDIILNLMYQWFDLGILFKKNKYRFFSHTMSDILAMSKLCDSLQDLSMALDERRYEMEGAEKTNNAVFVGTIFASKGLEFEHVFIPGMFLGAFPSFHTMTIQNSETDYRFDPIRNGGIDEEKRLLYVAITRAKNTCCLSYPSRTGKGPYSKTRSVSPLLYSLNLRNVPE